MIGPAADMHTRMGPSSDEVFLNRKLNDMAIRAAAMISIAAALFCAGCQTETISKNAYGGTRVTVNGTSDAPAVRSPQRAATPTNVVNNPNAANARALDATDPCAMQMWDISGAMLLYWKLHNQLPESLEELQIGPRLDDELVFKCALSSQPYVYVPQGMATPGSDSRLILYDQTPHRGKRWVIIASESRGKRPRTINAIPLTEAQFATYSKVKETPLAPPTTTEPATPPLPQPFVEPLRP